MAKSGFNWGGIVQDNDEQLKTKEKKLFGKLFKLFAIFILLPIIIYYALPGRTKYPPKSYCSYARSDANNIAAAIADYFADPSHTTLPTISGESKYLDYTLSSYNGKDQNIAWVSGDPFGTITIVVKDSGGKCSDEDQEHSPEWDSGKFTKIMEW